MFFKDNDKSNKLVLILILVVMLVIGLILGRSLFTEETPEPPVSSEQPSPEPTSTEPSEESTGQSSPEEPSQEAEEVSEPLRLSSPAFSDGNEIPTKYSREGENINPPLNINSIPEEAQHLALTMKGEDGTNYWAWYAIPVTESTIEIPEKIYEATSSQGWRRIQGYIGPYPESGKKEYTFTVFALDLKTMPDPGISIDELKNTMNGHIIDKATLVGTYNLK